MKKILVVALVVAHGLAWAKDDWSGIEQLIQSGRAAAAYETLARDEFARAGDADFDYWMGLAALEAGHADKATLAFERVLARNPNHAAARLDMGRAYFAMGDYERARTELLAVKALDAPPAARVTVDKYLAAIDEHRALGRTRWQGYVEAGWGTDSNVNVGPAQATIFLPVFGGNFLLAPGSRQAKDDYSQLGVGGEVLHPLGENRAVFAGADLRLRDYRRLDNYDYTSADLRGGYQFGHGQDAYRFSAAFNDYKLESDAYRRTASYGADWRRTLDRNTQVSAFGQLAQIRYVTDAMRSNDVNQWLLGANWASTLALQPRVTLSTTGFGGTEREQNERADGNKAFAGVRVGAFGGWRDDVDLFASASLQHGRYSRTNLMFDAKRVETQYDFLVGAAWKFAPAWSLRPQASWTHNDANLSIYDFRRYDVGIFVRRDFE